MTSSPQEYLQRKASYWHPEGEHLLCDLCPRRCRIPDSQTGFCGTRTNVQGQMIANNYGKVCASTVDPIEKKPIYHYSPGARLLSLGTFGCNLDCGYCQNNVLARAKEGEAPYLRMTAPEVVQAAKEKEVQGVAWTFNEPNVWFEFIMDTAEELHRAGLFSLLNTNGYIEPWAAEDLYEVTDVANIDIKGFTDKFYRSQCGGGLEEVLETCQIALEAGTHLELTYLLVPGMNDSAKEVTKFAAWVADELGVDIPVHLFRFSPFHRMAQLPEESMDRMEEAYEAAMKEGLEYVYFGGVPGHLHQSTLCPRCGELLIGRSAKEATEEVIVRQEKLSRFCPTYAHVSLRLEHGKCPKCGLRIPIEPES